MLSRGSGQWHVRLAEKLLWMSTSHRLSYLCFYLFLDQKINFSLAMLVACLISGICQFQCCPDVLSSKNQFNYCLLIGIFLKGDRFWEFQLFGQYQFCGSHWKATYDCCCVGWRLAVLLVAVSGIFGKTVSQECRSISLFTMNRMIQPLHSCDALHVVCFSLLHDYWNRASIVRILRHVECGCQHQGFGSNGGGAKPQVRLFPCFNTPLRYVG